MPVPRGNKQEKSLSFFNLDLYIKNDPTGVLNHRPFWHSLFKHSKKRVTPKTRKGLVGEILWSQLLYGPVLSRWGLNKNGWLSGTQVVSIYVVCWCQSDLLLHFQKEKTILSGTFSLKSMNCEQHISEEAGETCLLTGECMVPLLLLNCTPAD